MKTQLKFDAAIVNRLLLINFHQNVNKLRGKEQTSAVFYVAYFTENTRRDLYTKDCRTSNGGDVTIALYISYSPTYRYQTIL